MQRCFTKSNRAKPLDSKTVLIFSVRPERTSYELLMELMKIGRESNQVFLFPAERPENWDSEETYRHEERTGPAGTGETEERYRDQTERERWLQWNLQVTLTASSIKFLIDI